WRYLPAPDGSDPTWPHLPPSLPLTFAIPSPRPCRTGTGCRSDERHPAVSTTYDLRMALDDYLASEIVLDCADGIVSRREALGRLMLLGVTAPAAAALLAACGNDDETQASAPSASSGAAGRP